MAAGHQARTNGRQRAAAQPAPPTRGSGVNPVLALEAEREVSRNLAAENAKLRREFEHHRTENARRETIIVDLERDLAEAKDANETLRETNMRLEASARTSATTIERLNADLARMQDEVGRLSLDLADATRDAEALKADGATQETERLRRSLREMSGEAAMHRRRDERAHAALLALALRYGDAAAELMEREDDDAIASGRYEAAQ